MPCDRDNDRHHSAITLTRCILIQLKEAHSKIMPEPNRNHLITGLLLFVTMSSIYMYPRILCAEGITNYYVRYDIKSSKHRITDLNLLMIPSENEFRAENFAVILTSVRLNLTPHEPRQDFMSRARQAALQSILESHGLKSVQTRDLDTVISYEGAIISPVNILETDCKTSPSSCIIKAQVRFSPISFPDQWERQAFHFRIKQFFKNLFSVFQ